LLFLFTFPYEAGEFEMLKKLWLDEGGALLSVELILLVVITVIGITVGMVVLRDAVVCEFQGLAAAVNSIDSGYGWAALVYTGETSGAYVNGSIYDSDADFTAGLGVIANDVDGGLGQVISGDGPAEHGSAEILASP
jgi:hypothetical protein